MIAFRNTKLISLTAILLLMISCQASEVSNSSFDENSALSDDTSSIPVNAGIENEPSDENSTSNQGQNNIQFEGNPISRDDFQGVYLIGLTQGNFIGQSNGGTDVIFRSFSQNGRVLFNRQFGSGVSENLGMAVLSSESQNNLYLVGSTLGVIADGAMNNNLSDAFVRYYDTSNGLEITHQISSDGNDFGLGVDIDGTNGDIVVAGETEGDIVENAGGTDVFVRKYAEDGRALFSRQVGSEGEDSYADLKVDNDGKVFLLGTTDDIVFRQNFGLTDIFFRIFAANGRVELTRQLGTSSEDSAGYLFIEEESDILVIAGETSGNMRLNGLVGGKDIFFRTYDFEGRRLITRQFGSSSDDELAGAELVESNLIVAGTTSGDLWGQSRGGLDFFIRSYDLNGDTLFIRQFGTELDDRLSAIAVSPNGTIFVAGQTNGSYVGSSSGGLDIFVHAFDREGSTVFRRQFGSSSDDSVLSLIPSSDGGIQVIGSTSGDIVGENLGEDDLVIRKYDSTGKVSFTRQVGTQLNDIAVKTILR